MERSERAVDTRVESRRPFVARASPTTYVTFLEARGVILDGMARDLARGPKAAWLAAALRPIVVDGDIATVKPC